MACAQPAGLGAGVIANDGQRIATSVAAHQAIESSTAPAPARNRSRCGACAIRRARSGGSVVLFAVVSMVFSEKKPGGSTRPAGSRVSRSTRDVGGFDERRRLARREPLARDRVAER